MEGGSPKLIWERWTLHDWLAQQRYWADHPRLDQLAAAYFKIPRRKTPPPGAPSPVKLDWSLLSPV